MRVKEGITPARVREVKYCDLIQAIQKAQTAHEMLEMASLLCTDGFLDGMIDLSGWSLVLDRFDAILEAGLLLWGEHIVLGRPDEWDVELAEGDVARQATLTSAGLTEGADMEEVVKTIKAVLRCSSCLLHQAWNRKDIYHSADFLSVYMGAYDDDLSALVLSTMLALGEDSKRHKFVMEARQTTQLQKHAHLCYPLFDACEGAALSSRESAATMMDLKADKARFVQPSFVFDIGHIAEVVKNTRSPGMGDGLEDVLGGRQRQIHLHKVIIEDYLARDSSTGEFVKSNREVLDGSGVDKKYLLPLLWRLRMQRAVSTQTGRYQLLRTKLQCTVILLQCLGSMTALSSFFNDKGDILRDLVHLLQTGPGSVTYDPCVPFDLHVLACQCLVCVIHSRENNPTSVLGRFSWLQCDLGVNRGQYMGLLPCLWRNVTSFMTESRNETDDRQYMEWAQCVLHLTYIEITVSNALPASTDNGIIPLIVSVLRKPAAEPWAASPARNYAEGLLVNILERSLEHTLASTIFRDLGGMEVIVDKLLHELRGLCTYSGSDIRGVVTSSSASSSSSSSSSSSLFSLSPPLSPVPPS